MRRKRSWISVVLAILVVVSLFPSIVAPTASAAGERVSVWLTTGDKNKLLSSEADLTFGPDPTPLEYTINIDENVTYQQMDGFGASMTDSSAWVLFHALDESKRVEVMKQLFDPVDGAGFSYIRVPLGASDFALSHYTYNDVPEGESDPNLERFSIDHDKAYIIPLLKQALQFNPSLKFMGTPWSAPAWMKENQSLFKGKLKPENYAVYAQYFVKTIQAYEQEGITFDAVTLQNEPHYEPSNYAGMRMEPEDQAAFAKHLGPAFEAANMDTKIIIWDHNWNESGYPIEVLNDAEAKRYIAGSAFHGYAGSVESQSFVHDQHPDKGIYFTESSGGAFAPIFGDNLIWDVQNLIIGATRHWAKTSLKWNLALDQNHGPFIGGCEDCRGVVTVNTDTEEVTYNEEYYAFAHASKFVVPGAVRIKSNTYGAGSIEDVAFKNPDGSKVLIVLNSSKESKLFKVRWGGQSFNYELPAGAVATFKWNGMSEAAAMISPYSIVEAEDYSEMNGITTDISTDTAGGKFVGQTNDGDYIAFDNVEFVDGTASLKVRVASEQDARIEFRLNRADGPVVGSVDVANTGGWQAWKTRTAPVEGASGTHKLYLVFKGSVNLNWFQFSKDYYQDSLNYLSYNGGFEEGALDSWSGWNPEGQASAHKIDGSEPRSGHYKLTHWAADAYQQSTYRTVKVPNGTYKASVWLRKGNGIQTRLEVENYGGPDLTAEASTEFIGSWVQLNIEDIRVTNGQVEIGVYSNSPAGEWATFDDFGLSPVTTKAPAVTTSAESPASPQNLTANIEGDNNIQLTWDPVVSAGGYKIYRSVKNITEATVVNSVYVDLAELSITSSASTSYRDYGLQGNKTYYYVITAYNSNGESNVSNSVYGTTGTGVDAVAPAKPVGLRAMTGNEQIQLYWEHNLEKDFLKYNIYMNEARIASVDPVTETQYIVKNLVPGIAYQFAVSAVDKTGNESILNDSVTASPNASGVKVPFANLDFESNSLEGWSEWHPDGQGIAHFVDNDNPRGAYKLTHWGPTDYLQSTYRTLEVPNGIYKVQVWVRTGGGQNAFRLEVKNYGGDQLTKDMRSADGGTWTPFAIDNVRVTNGQLEVGVFSDAKAGNWSAIDDFEIYSYAPSVPAGLKGIGGHQSATLQWTGNTEHDIASYHIYQNGNFLNKVTSRTTTISGLNNGELYRYSISALDSEGNESMKSAEIEIVPNPPVEGANLGFELGDTTGWGGWNPNGNAHYVDQDGPRTGSHKLTHWAASDYMQTTYQTIKLDNGSYQVSTWVRTGGGQNALRMELKKFGSSGQTVDLKSASSTEWTLFLSEPIEVTTNELEIGLFSDGKSGNWTGFDDVQIMKLPGNAAPVWDSVEPQTVVVGHELTFTVTANDVDGDSMTYTALNLPQGASFDSVKKEFRWIAAVQGEHTVIFIVTDQHGQSSELEVKITVQAGPVVDSGNGNADGGTSDDDGSVVDEVEQQNGGDIIVWNENSLRSQAEKGKVVVTVGGVRGKKEVVLPVQAAEIIGLRPITVQSNDIAVEIPSSVLSGLQQSLIEKEAEGATIRFTLELVGVEQAQQLLSRAEGQSGATLTAAGNIYSFELFAVTASGKIHELTEFEEPIVLTFHVDPNTNLDLLGVYYLDVNGDVEYVGGKIENGRMVVKIHHFSKYAVLEFTKSFNDLSDSHWAIDAIQVLAAKHIVTGKTSSMFDPSGRVTRAEFAAMIVRSLGIDTEGNSTSRFSDVEASAWYNAYVVAASDAGIVIGSSASHFEPEALITREEIAIMLVRALELHSGQQLNTATPASFEDHTAISKWAVSAVNTAVELKLLQGDEVGFRPQDTATRAESAQVVYNLLGRMKH
ncbi:carbohydrate-binding protein [Paenibacillus sp. YYML68]|uniref:carbohydrate-binding protein n=1 Tax=Paenibacillus sp. YYML68 TaxID=2909250 RepID=UPI00248FB1A3|nr:carbohydrate-binding protein [Paenibacillus sp. YYML68]